MINLLLDENDSMSIKANDKFSKQWNYQPDTPIQGSPLFSWPLQPVLIFKWFADRWLSPGENWVLIAIGLISWHFFQPSLEETRVIEFSWVAEIYIRNLILITLVAGGLHLYFYTWKQQGKKLRHDARELNGKGPAYTFNSQLLDNMAWTLGSGVAFWTAYEVLMFWGMANGYAPILLWSDNPVWFIALFLLTPIWISFHFYWVHLWMHWPPVYRHVHRLHHRNTNIGPWSGLSMHPIEHLIYFSSILIHWFIAAHPLHILFHMQNQGLTASSSHTGFSGLLVKGKNRLALGTFHHQMHHRYLDCNYGNLEMPFDQWFGSFHDGTPESHERMQQNRRNP